MNPDSGRSFNEQCAAAKVEARVQASPNPGSPMQAIRMITLKSFNSEPVTVIEQNTRKTKHVIPPRGELTIGVLPHDELPTITKGI
jgi:hypothetical protein